MKGGYGRGNWWRTEFPFSSKLCVSGELAQWAWKLSRSFYLLQLPKADLFQVGSAACEHWSIPSYLLRLQKINTRWSGMNWQKLGYSTCFPLHLHFTSHHTQLLLYTENLCEIASKEQSPSPTRFCTKVQRSSSEEGGSKLQILTVLHSRQGAQIQQDQVVEQFVLQDNVKSNTIIS